MPTRRPPDLEAEVDALFGLPLAGFTAARNALAARLKKEGRRAEAERVKGLAKPAAPAWAVNQLYRENPKAFDRLFTAAEKIRKVQTGAAKKPDLAGLLDEKKRIAAELLSRAAAILEGAGHAASPDALRRVSATLESLAVFGSAADGPRAGRLTVDLDPPGFDALAGLMEEADSAKVLLFRPAAAAGDPAGARAAVRKAEKALAEARRDAERAEAALARARSRVAALEAQRQEIEMRCADAKAEAERASAEAAKAARRVAEAEKAMKG